MEEEEKRFRIIDKPKELLLKPYRYFFPLEVE